MPETSKTRDQLIDRVGQKLMVVGSGQSLSGEDHALVDSMVDEVLADLAGRRIVSVAYDDAIPIEQFKWIADCVAETAAPSLIGRATNNDVVMLAEMRLQKLTSNPPTYEVLRSEYY